MQSCFDDGETFFDAVGEESGDDSSENGADQSSSGALMPQSVAIAQEYGKREAEALGTHNDEKADVSWSSPQASSSPLMTTKSAGSSMVFGMKRRVAKRQDANELDILVGDVMKMKLGAGSSLPLKTTVICQQHLISHTGPVWAIEFTEVSL